MNPLRRRLLLSIDQPNESAGGGTGLTDGNPSFWRVVNARKTDFFGNRPDMVPDTINPVAAVGPDGTAATAAQFDAGNPPAPLKNFTSAPWNLNSDWTIGVFWRPDTSLSTYNQPIIMIGGDVAARHSLVIYQLINTGALVAAVYDVSNNAADAGNQTMSLNTWYNIVLRYTLATKKLESWINGVFSKEVTLVDDIKGGEGGQLWLGQWNSTTAWRSRGRIANVYFNNIAVNDQAIVDFYNGGNGWVPSSGGGTYAKTNEPEIETLGTPEMVIFPRGASPFTTGGTPYAFYGNYPVTLSGSSSTTELNVSSEFETTGENFHTGWYVTRAAIATPGSYTCAIWCRYTSGGNYVAISNGDAGNGGGFYIYLTPAAGTVTRFELWTGSAWSVATGTQLLANTWRHVCGTYDAVTQEQKIYENGTLKATVTGVVSASPTGGTMTVGRFSTGSNQWNGALWGPYWNIGHALSADAVKKLYGADWDLAKPALGRGWTPLRRAV